MVMRVLAGTVVCMAALAAAASPAPKVHEFVLDNGLKVLVKEDHRAPVLVSQIWYRVGSGDEHDGITGISHMLEHMMFKGTAKHPPGEFSRIIAAQGGTENAFTSRDYTAYYQKLAKDRLPISFELEADRMANVKLQDEEFLKERDVVAEERRLRTEDQPKSMAYEMFIATAYQTSPYRHPIVGWMADIQNYELDDLRDWYRRWYAPNNATLVVVGDVEPASVRRLAEQYFGDIPPVTSVPSKPRPEVAQRGMKRIAVTAPAEVPFLVMGYQTPSLATTEVDWEPYALAVLAAVLAGDDSARFPRDLVRGQQVAAQAGADYDLYSRRSTLFTFDGTPAQGHSLAEVEQAIREQIERVRDEPVSEAELKRVKTGVVASDVYQRDSVFYQAMRLGALEAIGLGWRVGDDYVSHIQAVTPEQVQAVARKYLVDEHLTVAVLDTTTAEAGADKQAKLGGQHVH
jgi:zinc protease